MAYDAGLCHGSAGVAMIFHYMYRQTGDERLRAACDFWHEQTLAHARWEDGIAGYKFFFLRNSRSGVPTCHCFQA